MDTESLILEVVYIWGEKNSTGGLLLYIVSLTITPCLLFILYFSRYALGGVCFFLHYNALNKIYTCIKGK